MIELKIAGLKVRILNDNPLLNKRCEKYICCDRLSPPDITIKVDRFDMEKEKISESDSKLLLDEIQTEYLSIYRKLCEKILDFDGFLMHASVVEKDGEAFAFTAPSGTGKSTHARLWRENLSNVHSINDDKPIIKVIDGVVYACGTPWCGKHNLSENVIVPLRGICFLEQADVNTIMHSDPKSEIHNMLFQVYRPNNEKMLIKTLDLVDKVIGNVPIYRMKCNMEPEAAYMSYNMMHNEQNSVSERF